MTTFTCQHTADKTCVWCAGDNLGKEKDIKPTCRGSLILGSGCGLCERCNAERERLGKEVVVAANTTPLDTILAERGSRYGTFMQNASIAQGVKALMKCAPQWKALEYDQSEALDVIAAKISRILSGDPNYIDNWDDIAGYATLVANRLRGDAK